MAREQARPLAPLRFMATHALLGMAVGAAAGLLLVVEDVGGLASLLARTPGGALLAMALVLLLATTCGGVQIAFAIGLLAEAGPEDGAHQPRPAAARKR